MLGILLLLPCEPARIHVDGDKGLRGLDDDVAPGRKGHLLLESKVDFLLDAVLVEKRERVREQVEPVQKIGVDVPEISGDLGVDLRVVHREGVELIGEQVTDHSADELGFAMNKGRSFGRLGLLLDCLPGLVEPLELLLEGVPIQLLTNGSNNYAPTSFGNDLLGEFSEAGSLTPLLDLPADPYMGRAGHENEEPSRAWRSGSSAGGPWCRWAPS